MVAIPFIYLSCLLIYVLKKKRTYDISAYLISIYLVSSFFSIIIDLNDLRSEDTKYYEIGLLPTMVYCLLLTIVFYPFIKLPIQNKLIIQTRPKFFKLITYWYIVIFFLLLLMSYKLILQIISGDMSAIRLAIHKGEISTAIQNSLPLSIKPIATIVTVFSSTSIIMLLFYFYNICFNIKTSKIFSNLLFISSLSIVVLAILGVDRSKIIYWLLSYGFFLVLFWKNMTKKQHKSNLIGFLIVMFGISFYFIILTISRFGESDSGINNSLVSYAGQSFINFSYFFENKPFHDYTLQRVFPMYHHFFMDTSMSTGELNRLMTELTGIQHGVFSTFMGDILMSSNIFTTIIFCLIISRIARFLLIKNYNMHSFYFYVLLFFFISIPLLGLFTHFYAYPDRAFIFVLFVVYSISFGSSKRIH